MDSAVPLSYRIAIGPLGVPAMKTCIARTPADPRGRADADMYSAGIDALRARGELAAILAKYSLSDWKSPDGPE